MGESKSKQMPDHLIYEVGEDTDPDKQWADKSDFLDEVMLIFNIEDTEGHEEFVLLKHVLYYSYLPVLSSMIPL